jgi:hypothetical protein
MATKRGDPQGVIQWRLSQLIDAGFPRSLAVRLARDDRYDLHELIQLGDRCSPALAARILEPIERDDAA